MKSLHAKSFVGLAAALVGWSNTGCQPAGPAGPERDAFEDADPVDLDASGKPDVLSDFDLFTSSDVSDGNENNHDLSDAGGSVGEVKDDCGGGAGADSCLPLGRGAKHIILFVGDGMGAEQYRAARLSMGGPLSFDAFPHQASMRTADYFGGVTDSAAAATAMATGFKVRNGTISVARPGDGAALESVVELHQRLGHRVGLGTVMTPMTDATPAGFGAHADSRYEDARIADSMLKGTRPDLLLGRASSGMNPIAAAAAGYVVASDEASLRAMSPATPFIAGLFDDASEPALATLTTVALDALAAGGHGFFVLLETEQADTGGHNNQLAEVVAGVAALSEAVAVARAWAEGRDDTLIVVLSDHETGGLIVHEGPIGADGLPPHAYTTGGHTGAEVPVFAWGVGAEAIAGPFDNTHIFQILAPVHHTSFEDQAVSLAIAESNPNESQVNVAMNLDQDDPGGSGLEAQGLLRFDGLQSGPNAIPTEAVIVSAYLVLTSGDDGDALALFPMLIPWDAETTWASLGGDGVTRDDLEAASNPDALSAYLDEPGFIVLDVTARVRAWVAGEANHGWALVSSFTNGVDIQPVGGPGGPQLVVRYLLPR